MRVLSISIACFALCVASAAAGVIAMPAPGATRVVGADVVIVGKVEAIEPTDVKVGMATFRIAVVKINDGIKGTKDAKTLRVGFTPIEKPKPNVFVSGARPVQLNPGQEGLFILKKHDKENFYTLPGVIGFYINSDKNTGFDKEVQSAKLAARLSADPQAGLKAKDADQRLLAASILIDRYRNVGGPKVKLQPIDAEESKLILQALAEADWQMPYNFASLRPIPTQLFQRLGVNAQDGFNVPKGGNFQKAAQEWVRANAGKYRIQRFVADEGQ
ncbi:MAG TPA: hypothetical protein VFE62_27225 [Gemmataceae bacterium]|nr:hypothetical protein [Gemmataceae bacterium]